MDNMKLHLTWMPLSLSLALYMVVGASLANPKPAAVDVADAWIRPTVAGQQGTGGFMKLTAREDLRLVGVSSPVTPTAEVHEMRASKEQADVMEMRRTDSISLPKGVTVELRPGGYHLMLMNLKQVLANGSTVPLTLHFTDAKGRRSELPLKVAVKTSAAGSAFMPMDKANMPAHKQH
jgi:periplasmic copper chaperone A